MPDIKEPSRRTRMIANTIREELVTIARKDLNDPALERVGMITFSSVELADDMRTGVAWCAFMGKEEKERSVQEALAALNHSAKYIQRLLIKRIPVKLHPVLNFRFDNGFDRAAVVGAALAEAAELERETLRQRAEQGEPSVPETGAAHEPDSGDEE